MEGLKRGGLAGQLDTAVPRRDSTSVHPIGVTAVSSLSSLLGLGGFSTINIRRWLPITSIIGDSLDQLDVYRTRVTSDELSSSAGVEKEYGPHGPRHTS